ncbi:MAG: glycine--tRNA ligase subunit beta, partial [bacterium]|nr:glycine--tRNA ligase subunit beta [bacterium]
SHSGPRRLTLIIKDVADKSPDISQERKGPRVGAPEQALAGFLRGAGLDSIDQCEIVSDKKGEFYLAKIEKKGSAADEILAQSVKDAILKMPWPKSMRWGNGSLRWVRPLHSILCLLDGKVIDLEVEGIKSANTTVGHRFMAPKALKVGGFADYESSLIAAFVMTNAKAREQAILDQAQKLAKKAKLELVEDAGLLSETAGLNEWPTVLMGDFDKSFLDVPSEVLITSMKKHQKCFSLKDPKTGKLANKFLLVSNMIATDKGKAITHGNERVIRARLSDAVFFWEQDKKVPLEEMAAKLNDIIFHDKLGSQGERVLRMATLARELACVVGADPDESERAAKLCKADLVSEMVGEFANLQGLMGRYYAEQQGESKAVAAACEEHYRPQGPSDEIPTEPISVAVALADKLDILTGFWASDEKPTGSKDPFALRRAALGVIRIVMENEIRLNLIPLITEKLMAKDTRYTNEGYEGGVSTETFLEYVFSLSGGGYGDGTGNEAVKEHSAEIATDLLSFFADRLKVYLKDKGARHDLIDAVFSLGGQDDLLMIVKRVEALGSFLETDDGADLLAGIKRAVNILRIEEKKDKQSYQNDPDKGLLSQKEEKDLFAAIEKMDKAATMALAKEDFVAAMSALAALKSPVDAFFDKVTVNADEPKVRHNRLALLAQIRTATTKIADFSKIEG